MTESSILEVHFIDPLDPSRTLCGYEVAGIYEPTAQLHPASGEYLAMVTCQACRSKFQGTPGGDMHSGVRKCRVCGCTNDRACLTGFGVPCYWVEDDLCSACKPEASSGVTESAAGDQVDQDEADRAELDQVNQDAREIAAAAAGGIEQQGGGVDVQELEPVDTDVDDIEAAARLQQLRLVRTREDDLRDIVQARARRAFEMLVTTPEIRELNAIGRAWFFAVIAEQAGEIAKASQVTAAAASPASLN